MDEEQFRAYVRAYNEGDIETVSSYWAEDVDVDLPGHRSSPSGKDEFLAHFEDLHSKIDEHIEIEDLFVNEDGTRLAVSFHSTFTAKQDVPDFVYGPLEEGDSTTNRAFLHYTIDDDDEFEKIEVAQRDPSPSMGVEPPA